MNAGMIVKLMKMEIVYLPVTNIIYFFYEKIDLCAVVFHIVGWEYTG